MATGTGLAPVRGFRNLLATDPFRLLQQKMGRFFDEPFAPLAFQAEEPFALTTWTPSCDIYEANGEIIVKAELPGLKKEDVKVMIENNVLTIRGERKFEEEVKREDYYRIERSSGEEDQCRVQGRDAEDSDPQSGRGKTQSDRYQSGITTGSFRR
jgi:HSP20 family molecular chaperone IbpA